MGDVGPRPAAPRSALALRGASASRTGCPARAYSAGTVQGRLPRPGLLYVRSMPEPAHPGTQGWLTDQEASARLDVHPAKLRQWADRGEIRTFRTQGGHRRFSAEDVEALLGALSNGLSPELDLLLSAALGRARRQAGGRRLVAQRWYQAMGPESRERSRQARLNLLGLLARHLRGPDDPALVLAEARHEGREQGRLAREAGLTMEDAVRAYVFIRNTVVESILQMKAGRDHGRQPDDVLGFYRQVGVFFDEVLVSYLDAFSEASG